MSKLDKFGEILDEEVSGIVTYGHCKGEGVCQRCICGGGGSCVSCVEAAGKTYHWKAFCDIYPCSVCGGVGKVRVRDR